MSDAARFTACCPVRGQVELPAEQTWGFSRSAPAGTTTASSALDCDSLDGTKHAPSRTGQHRRTLDGIGW